MVDVVLAHSYHLPYDAKQLRKMQPYRPLGTLYAATALQQAGFSVAMFDSMLRSPNEFETFVMQHNPRIVAIYEDDFNFLTKMCLSRMRDVVWNFAGIATRSGVPIVVHGSDASDNPGLFFDHGIDYVLHGEAEAALVTLCSAVMASGNVQGIPGLLVREGKEQVASIARAENQAWANSPTPPLELTDFAPYRDAWKTAHGYFSVNMVASRGCPFRCNWCAKPISGNRFQLRSAREVAAEMHHLKTVVGAEHIWFSDDVFALNQHWVSDFATEVATHNAALPFKIQSRADLMSDHTVQALKQAGCAEVWMGVESGSQRVLDSMDKGLKLSSVVEARNRLKQAGIKACYFLQFGYPGEQWDDLLKTIKLVRETQPDDVGISFSYPLPGTAFYARVQQQLGLKRNWKESDDLCILFHGEYATDFYRAVREALHAEVDSWSRPSMDAKSKVAVLWQEVERMEPLTRIADTSMPRMNSKGPIKGFVSVDALYAKAGV